MGFMEHCSRINRDLASSCALLQADKYIDERHRHRYEVNPAHVELLEKSGLKFVGRDESGERMEIIELNDHPYFVAAQFHPEFKSRPFKPSPLFLVSTAVQASPCRRFKTPLV